MEEERKMKVAMICHFSNKEAREHLPLSKHRLYRLARKMLRMPGKGDGYGDIALWNCNIIEATKERNDIELYVISAHSGLKKSMVSFDAEGIHYHFIRCEIATLLKKLIPNDNLWRALNPMSPKVKKLVNCIKPDLVLLIGTENAYYSSTILSIQGYPVYVLCQTVYNNPEFGKLDKKNASTELKILEKERYVGVYSDKHYHLLRGLGYNHYVFGFQWPSMINYFVPTPCEEKQFDFINFALHMSRDKGFHDCIKALAIVKQKYPHVKLDLVDGGNDVVRAELKQMIKELNLEDNVTFTPFFAEQNDLFQHLQSARFAVLPSKVDHISGTQLQSMKYGLPVVCYKTTGTPSLNAEKECVLIAEMNDVEGLAEKMLLLMDNPALAEQLRHNSFDFSQKRIQMAQQNMPRLVENFKAIIDNYKFGTPIPKEQLFTN
jgi:glycosyltransferase involved in cell wall biosynthesis